MKRKRVSAFLICAVLLSGCGGQGGAVYDTSAESEAVINSESEEVMSENSENEESSVRVIKSDEKYDGKIHINFLSTYDSAVDEDIISMLNDKLDGDGYDFAVDFTFIDQYARSPIDYYEECVEQNISVDIMSTGISISKESIDSDPDYYTCKLHNNTYDECVEKGYLVPLGDFFKTENGRKLYDSFNENYWAVLDRNGEIYGICTAYMKYAPTCLEFNDRVAEEYGFDVSDFDGDIKSLEPILKKIKSESGSAGLVYYGEKKDCYKLFDFSNPYSGIYINERTGLAENPFENKEIVDYIKMMSDWKNKGYIVSADSLGDMATSFCSLLTLNPLIYKEDTTSVPISTSYVNNSGLSSCIGVTAMSEHKEQAEEFLGLLFSDTEYANILCIGKEGSNYVTENGYGVLNEENPTFYTYLDYFNLPANPFISTPVSSGSGKENTDKKNLSDEMYGQYKKSCVYGFEPNLSRISDKTDSLQEIYDTFSGLFYGEYESDKYENIDAAIEAVNGQLKAAGIDDVLGEVNNQLEEYYEKNS
jgi:hypothetical protein